MDLQFPPSWIKFSNYRHQCAPPWDALAVDASILITQPRAFDFKIDWVLTNRAVAVITVITFPPQGLQGSANLAFNSRYHTQTALDDIAEAEKSSPHNVIHRLDLHLVWVGILCQDTAKSFFQIRSSQDVSTNHHVTNHFRLTKNIVEEIQTMLMGLESQRIASHAMIESNLSKMDKGTLAVSHPQPKIPVLPPCPRHLFIISANLFPELLSKESTSIDEISPNH